jgi:hypothetical protein
MAVQISEDVCTTGLIALAFWINMRLNPGLREQIQAAFYGCRAARKYVFWQEEDFLFGGLSPPNNKDNFSASSAALR